MSCASSPLGRSGEATLQRCLDTDCRLEAIAPKEPLGRSPDDPRCHFRMDVCPDWMARTRDDGIINLWYRHNDRNGQEISPLMALLTVTGLSTDSMRLINDVRQHTNFENPRCPCCEKLVYAATGVWAPTCTCRFHRECLSDAFSKHPGVFNTCPSCRRVSPEGARTHSSPAGKLRSAFSHAVECPPATRPGGRWTRRAPRGR